MSDSNSSSQANQTSNYTDGRTVLGQGANWGSTLDSNNSTAFTTKNSGNTTTTSTFSTKDSGNTTSTFATKDSGNTTNTNSGNTTITSNALDNGAIGASFDSTNQTVSQAFKFGTNALGFGSNALSFGSNALAGALSATGDAVGSALAFAQHAQDASMSANSYTLAAALAYGQKQTASALDSLNTSAQMIDTAYADAKGRGAMTDYLLLAAIVVCGFVAYRASRKA
jgi:hypothetical protein